MFASRSRSAFTRLVLPAPEGATTTKRLAGMWDQGNGVRPRSLDVLDLFPHLLDQHLELHGNARHVVGDRLGAERIGLAVQLLAEEIQALAAGAALVEHAAVFRDVGLQARDLLVHVDA